MRLLRIIPFLVLSLTAIGQSTPTIVTNVSTLLLLTPTPTKPVYQVLGKVTANDGLGRDVIWSASSTAATNTWEAGGPIARPWNSASGRYITLTNTFFPTPSTASGTSGRLAKFTGANSVGNSIITESGTTDTVAGNLAFSGTTTPGLIPNNLTAVQIGNLVAPPVGSTVFNSTSLQLNMWDGATWNELRTGNYLPISGGALTGNLLWNTTTAPGLRLNNLTTVQRDSTTPAAGSIIWNTTTSRANVFDGSLWSAGWVRLNGDTMTGALLNSAGTITASTPNQIVQTWNNGAVAFAALEFNITSTANLPSFFMTGTDDGTQRFFISNGGTINAVQFTINSDVTLLRDGANTFGQRTGANAQTYNLYGTYTDASNYRRLRSTMTTGGAVTVASEGLGSGVSGNTYSVSVDGTTRLSIASTGVPTFTTDQLRLSTFKTPSSASDTGTAGTICYDANFIYICTAANTWKRVAIATW